jgi:hypothetical protein
MEEVNSNLQMETNIMVSTKMVNLTVTESINGLQEISIKENSLKDLGKDRELLKILGRVRERYEGRNGKIKIYRWVVFLRNVRARLESKRKTLLQKRYSSLITLTYLSHSPFFLLSITPSKSLNLTLF